MEVMGASEAAMIKKPVFRILCHDGGRPTFAAKASTIPCRLKGSLEEFHLLTDVGVSGAQTSAGNLQKPRRTCRV